MNTTTVLSIIALGLIVLGKAFIFKKMNVEMWKSLIPIYSDYILFKKVWNTKMFMVELLSTVAGGVALAVAQTLGHTTAASLLVGSSMVFGAVSIVISIAVLAKLAKAFGHGFGYTLGLMFLQPVFMPVLGFNNSQYQGA
ncbi:MAG: DUF5684 domain-containing protein [Bacillota bacterium]|nr:DUF5684 domain-containing protein [Bacillota bacterium]